MRVQGRLPSVVKGVSQQAAFDRLDGQVTEMVNLIADPVRGLVRRNGMILQEAFDYSENGGQTREEIDQMLIMSQAFRAYPVVTRGEQFTILYRNRPMEFPENSMGSLVVCTRTFPQSMVVIAGSDQSVEAFHEHGYSSVTTIGDYILLASNTKTAVVEVESKWMSEENQGTGIVQISAGNYGREYTIEFTRGTENYTVSYTVPAADYPGTLDVSSVEHTPEETYQQRLNDVLYTYEANQNAWRVYSSRAILPSSIARNLERLLNGGPEVFEVELKFGLQPVGEDPYTWDIAVTDDVVRVTFTSATYPTTLNNHEVYITYPERFVEQRLDVDGDFIPHPENIVPGTLVNDPDGVGDLNVFEFQVNVERIDGVDPTGSWERVGSTLYTGGLDKLSGYDDAIKDSIKVAFREVQDISDLPGTAKVGMVMRVRPMGNSDEAFYVQAHNDSLTTIGAVDWRETAGEVQQIKDAFLIGRFFKAVNGQWVFYVAGSPEQLEEDINTVISLGGGDPVMEPGPIDVPKYIPSRSGDMESNPPPGFLGKPITLLTTWQNRLVVVAEDTVSMSAVGDYFNFFRESLLTLGDNDPVLEGIRGVDGDVVRQAQVYDGNLMLFGDGYHYLINGDTPMTPMNPRIKVQYKMAGTSRTTPVSTGPFVYILKEDLAAAGSARLLQIRAGVWRDTTDVVDCAMQLRDYINGTPAEIVPLMSPGMVAIRTEQIERSLYAFPVSGNQRFYVYQYTDGPDGSRIHEAWGAWEFSSSLGSIMGISDNGEGDGFLVYTMIPRPHPDGTWGWTFAILHASGRSEPSGLPYMDGLALGASHPMYTNSTWRALVQDAVTAPDASQSYLTTNETRTSLRTPSRKFGDDPPERIDTGRWDYSNGFLDRFLADYPSSSEGSTVWTGVGFSAYVDLTNPYRRNRMDNSIIRGRLVITRLRVVTTRTAGLSAEVADYSGIREVLRWEGEFKQVEYVNSVGIGRDTNHYECRLQTVGPMPMTITAIEWDGNFFNTAQGV